MTSLRRLVLTGFEYINWRLTLEAFHRRSPEPYLKLESLEISYIPDNQYEAFSEVLNISVNLHTLKLGNDVNLENLTLHPAALSYLETFCGPCQGCTVVFKDRPIEFITFNGGVQHSDFPGIADAMAVRKAGVPLRGLTMRLDLQERWGLSYFDKLVDYFLYLEHLEFLARKNPEEVRFFLVELQIANRTFPFSISSLYSHIFSARHSRT